MAAAGKKLLMLLAGDRDGRKILRYVVAISLFFVFLPLIAVYGLFGRMANGIGEESLPENIPDVYAYEEPLRLVEETFRQRGLSETDTEAGQLLYLSCLCGRENEEDFYPKLADCFDTTRETDVLTNVGETFGVIFTEADREQFDNLYPEYGVTGHT